MSGRPRRKAAMKQGHIESGGEQYHLDQVKQMKRGTLLKNFSTFDETTGTYHCRFQPNCSKTYQRGEMMSLSAHLLIHVRDACERSVKNPKFYENLIFHSVPVDKQFDVGTAFNESGEKINPALRPGGSNHAIPWFFKQLNLTKRRQPNQPTQTVHNTLPVKQNDFDVYREWKRYCFLARKNVRSEAIENSMKERHVLPTPIIKRDPTIQSNPALSIQHRRISIFNRLTNQMQQSVIKLNPSKPVPTRVRRLNFTTDELSPVKMAPMRTIEETIEDTKPVKTQLTVKLNRPSVICPNPTLQVQPVVEDDSVIENRNESDSDDEIDFNQLKRRLTTVKNAFNNNSEKIKRPRISIEKSTYSIPKKLQAVNNTESIFTIQATFSTFGTRGKTKRMLDLVGPTLVDDETQIKMAIRRSLEESSQANETTSQNGKKQRGSSGAGIRRNTTKTAQMHQMGKVTS